jgi:hypothetical protein
MDVDRPAQESHAHPAANAKRARPTARPFDLDILDSRS